MSVGMHRETGVDIHRHQGGQPAFMCHIAKEPGHRLVEDVLAGMNQTVEALFPAKHGWAAEVKLDHPSGLQTSVPLDAVRLSHQASSLICRLVEIQGELPCSPSATASQRGSGTTHRPST